ncbi:myosin-10 [Dorcoceras hygrometricum]|uniref:Myosin-10 n=1 Tax=Dorcoceras hygrometricum TaxID=472368 RepID=A0A2Z7BXF8_9LAMI|nr:myosin-10 [Dorcoceras hygrometricum]
MDQNSTSNESLNARIEQLEKERDELHKDVEQLCMQQAGPSYLGVVTRMHFQRMAGLEQEIENLKAKLAVCTRENQNLQEELSEAYRIKSQLADLHSTEVLKNIEAEKQLKFFQACVASAFAERDNAIMEAEKAKEREELMPNELNESKKRIEELTSELLEEKKLVTALQIDVEKQKTQHEIFRKVIDKFYSIRQDGLENIVDTSLENKCDCLLNDSAEMWRFENDEETSTSCYISSLEAEIDILKKGVDNLQDKLLVGVQIESHLKKKFKELQKSKTLSEEKMRTQISALICFYSQFKSSITNLLEEWRMELKSISDMVVEKVMEIEPSGEQCPKSSLIQDVELSGSECRDVHVTTDSNRISSYKAIHSDLQIPDASRTGDTSNALAQALQEKVEALLLLSQQDERHLLEKNVNAALEKKIEELQRNLLQVTNEKVKALMELANMKQEKYVLQEKISQDIIQGKHFSESGEQRPEKDGKFKNFLKRNYLSRWVGGSEENDAESCLDYEKPNFQMDFARMKIEHATFKESLENMEHLLSSVRRLRILLLKVKDSAADKAELMNCFDSLDKIIAESRLVKIALGSSLPVSCFAETDGSHGEINDGGSDPGLQKVDFVSAAGFEMVDLLIFAAHLLKEHITHQDQGELDPNMISET